MMTTLDAYKNNSEWLCPIRLFPFIAVGAENTDIEMMIQRAHTRVPHVCCLLYCHWRCENNESGPRALPGTVNLRVLKIPVISIGPARGRNAPFTSRRLKFTEYFAYLFYSCILWIVTYVVTEFHRNPREKNETDGRNQIALLYDDSLKISAQLNASCGCSGNSWIMTNKTASSPNAQFRILYTTVWCIHGTFSKSFLWKWLCEYWSTRKW